MWSARGVSYINIIIVPPVYYVKCQAALYSAYCQAPPSLTPVQLYRRLREDFTIAEKGHLLVDIQNTKQALTHGK